MALRQESLILLSFSPAKSLCLGSRSVRENSCRILAPEARWMRHIAESKYVMKQPHFSEIKRLRIANRCQVGLKLVPIELGCVFSSSFLARSEHTSRRRMRYILMSIYSCTSPKIMLSSQVVGLFLQALHLCWFIWSTVECSSQIGIAASWPPEHGSSQ